MSPIDRFAIYSWLGVYYRRAAKEPGFESGTAEGRWAALRAVVLADNPPNDAMRREAIDGIREGDRPDILSWLDAHR